MGCIRHYRGISISYFAFMAMEVTTWNATWQAFIEEEEAKISTGSANYLPTSFQLAALKTMFSDPTVPMSEIAKLITVDSILLKEKSPGASDSGLWRILADGIKQLTEYNDKFVELFFEIAQVPIYGSDLSPQFCLRYYWEWWTEWVWGFSDPPSTDPNREAKRQGWTNLNAWCAKVSHHRDRFHLLDNRGRVSWIRFTLERNPWETYDPAKYADEGEEAQTHNRELHDVKALDAKVPAAAVWFQVDAQAIYDLNGHDMGFQLMPAETDWTGKEGFSRERFVAWRERFEWISEIEVLEERTRKAAKEAAEAMKKVEDANSDISNSPQEGLLPAVGYQRVLGVPSED
ncbi:hypothetical protein G7Y89_g3609 [Cudoniella acicularis]|uniref:Uncharacterized protein n=1 Tax=Cudoniella acicularis TaxID=354080 RepID=A0A8H4RRW5_9HELO|nr:hypothetical protein G7Y89_g3609 [Cudoniella acicularis]